MSRVNHFKVGLFVLLSIVVGVGGLLWVGASNAFRNTKTYASYFSESVDGLDSGAGVKYLGVKVGTVSSVELVPGKKLVRVLMDLKPSFQVDGTMAVELKLQGITGQFNLGIVTAPDNIADVTPPVDYPTKYPVIPSRPGQLTRIQNALDAVYKKFNSIDLNTLIAQWTETGRSVGAVAASDQLKGTLENVSRISEHVESLTADLNRNGTGRDLEVTLNNLAEAAKAARKASESLSTQMAGLPSNSFGKLSRGMEHMMQTGEKSVSSVDSQVEKTLVGFQQTLTHLNQVLAELKDLAQSLKENPGRILTRPSGGDPFRR